MLRAGKYYDFGDYSSSTLMMLAWKALDEENPQAVELYTNKCIELYSQKAHQMQRQLQKVPKGTKEEILAWWALNDVATAYFIQGESYFRSDQLAKAKEAYQRVLEEFPSAQCWDPRGWFWIVADGAKEKIKMIDTGLFLNFWDYSSQALVTKAWQAFKNKDVPRALGYADKCIELYSPQAREMQRQLDDFPQGGDNEKHAYWALNDVATAHYIKGEVYFEQNQHEDARKEFTTLVKEYPYAQSWDPRGWWWKPAVEAQNWLGAIAESGKK
jgi:tetratricopeptide (TPR) repeat protein